MPQERRFFIESEHCEHDALVALSTSDEHHAREVLRLREGATLTIVERETGNTFLGTVETTTPLRVRVGKAHTPTDDYAFVDTLVFALCKGKRNDFVCEKATELGVKNIVLWQSERSIVRLEDGKIDSKKARWEKIIETAAKQSQKSFIPKLHIATDFSGLSQTLNTLNSPQSLRICGSLRASAPLLTSIKPRSSSAQMVIGPEGDLSDSEQDRLVESGFQLVSLGPFTLRSETAAIVSVAMIQALWGFQE